jgi:hypothetical protein
VHLAVELDDDPALATPGLGTGSFRHHDVGERITGQRAEHLDAYP